MLFSGMDSHFRVAELSTIPKLSTKIHQLGPDASESVPEVVPI
ncbi:hypothetical protein GA0115254_121840 [Streptomyces sp. Ncost-T10-10d]|nr:hypothetical protein GA0115254_121840 [Streptomyces sp. Ncost-T10-10d]